jgi:Tfp pilus assembly ATPase PilU
MRDCDTVEAAIAAAETGHLVFSTLIWNDLCQLLMFQYFLHFSMTLSSAGCFDDESV